MKRPVVILGFIPRIVVPIARSLHRHGVPVDVANFVSATRIRSRAIRKFVRLPYAAVDPVGFVKALRDFIAQEGHDMLIPADDSALSAVVEHYSELKDMLHVACPPPEIAGLVLNKASTLEVAQKCGIRIPKTAVVSNSMQFPDFVDNVPFPWILKPSAKAQRGGEFKSCLVTSLANLARTFPAAREFDPPLLLQEYCQGAGVGVEMLMQNGECVAMFQHRRLQELPYSGGFAVTAVAESPDSALVQSSLALLRALHWNGIAMVEFKVNPADGCAVLMEVNGRYWGTISLPLIAGVDFPLYQWKLLHGEEPDVPASYNAGTRWRWTVGYLLRLHGLVAASGRSRDVRKNLFLTLLHSPNAFACTVHDSLLMSADPMPAVFELLWALKYYAIRDMKKLFGREDVQSDASAAGRNSANRHQM